MRRRDFMKTALAAPMAAAAAANGGNIPLGLNTYCLRAMRWKDEPLLDYTAGLKLDAVFLQDSLDPQAQDPAHWKVVRGYAEKLGLHLETGGGAIIPKTDDGFAQSVKTLEHNIVRAKALGSPIVRCLLASNRASFPPGPAEKHMETAIRIFKAVRSQAQDAGVKLALENHKDLQCWETRIVLEEAGTDLVGSYLDTGNPVFVLEHPLTTVETLGPYAVTFHLRDSIVFEHPRGVAVQWVPLGEGTVDFKQIVGKMKEVCPPVHVYVKPITGRPPEVLPYLEEGFWKTYPKARAGDLSRFLALAKRGTPYDKPMVVEDIPGRTPPEEFVAAIQRQQREHMERSVAYAKNELGLGVRWRS